jgi:hypothetical protein
LSLEDDAADAAAAAAASALYLFPSIGSINTIEISLAINYSCTPQAISTQ